VRQAALIAEHASGLGRHGLLCDDFVANRQKFNQMPPPTVTVC
jgi:hypothetical protein